MVTRQGNIQSVSERIRTGLAHFQAGRLQQAHLIYREILNEYPDHPGVLHLTGLLYHRIGRNRLAVNLIKKAIRRNPNVPAFHNNLGNVLRDLCMYNEAASHFRRALSINPNLAESHNNLGNIFKNQGYLGKAVTCYQNALAIRPDYNEANNNLLMALSYIPSGSSSKLLARATNWAKTCRYNRQSGVFDNAPNPDRRLKIGYVSADFIEHPVGHYMAGILPYHSKRFDITCYTNTLTADDLTVRLKSCANRWRNISNLADDEAEKLIREDKIDLLIDLSGHTARNRLPLFARKPAPVQVTWLGYFGTTGLDSMDYILADRFVIPDGEESFFTERVYRMPHSYLCMDIPNFDLEPAPPPAMTNGKITLGCLNNRAKITLQTIAVWSGILNSLPDSRLLLKNRQYQDPGVRQIIRKLFTDNGIDADRIQMEGSSPRKDLLATYQRIDIALDTFPFGGGITTAEALWMGVPVITVRGDRWVGRVTESILTTAGLIELVTINLEEYRSLVVELASDLSRLAQLRSTLRNKLETSPVCDGRLFVAGLENAYQDMWKKWCLKNDTKKK